MKGREQMKGQREPGIQDREGYADKRFTGAAWERLFFADDSL